MSWDQEKFLKLIKQFEINEVLWKKNDRDYHNIIKKDAWWKISEVKGEDLGTCKKKMESIRGSRRREKQRMNESVGTGKHRRTQKLSKEGAKFEAS